MVPLYPRPEGRGFTARWVKLIAVSRGRLPICAGDRLCPAVAPSLILDMSLFADVLKHASVVPSVGRH